MAFLAGWEIIKGIAARKQRFQLVVQLSEEPRRWLPPLVEDREGDYWPSLERRKEILTLS
jgi:hypothetical protein